MTFSKGQYVFVTKDGILTGAGQITDGGGAGVPYVVRMAGTADYVRATAEQLELHPQQSWAAVEGPRPEIVCTIWVCQCCMLAHANGECCDSEQHGGDGVEPWAKLDDGEHVTMGIALSEHGEYCLANEDGECDCEHDTYSTSQCGGCGSYLHGERHAFTLWRRAGVSLAKTA